VGLFVSELVRRRREALAHSAELMEHVRVLEEENRKRETAERQVRTLIHGSPAAILAIDADGNVVLANDAARSLFWRDGRSILGEPIESVAERSVRPPEWLLEIERAYDGDPRPISNLSPSLKIAETDARVLDGDDPDDAQRR